LKEGIPRHLVVASKKFIGYHVACNDRLKEVAMASTPVNARVQKHRDALRLAGLRPVQIWVPDTRRAGFAQECRRQCRLVADADQADDALTSFMHEALTDVDGWTP
jgi:hypothetical protein